MNSIICTQRWDRLYNTISPPFEVLTSWLMQTLWDSSRADRSGITFLIFSMLITIVFQCLFRKAKCSFELSPMQEVAERSSLNSSWFVTTSRVRRSVTFEQK